jgi:hypothetical protein
MDHETNKQEPSGKKGGEMKAGDMVWVLAKVEQKDNADLQLRFGSEFTLWLPASDCRPVEQAPKQTTPKEPTRGQKLAERTLKGIWAANDAVNGTPVIKQSLTTESSCPKILDSSSDPVNPSHYKQGGIECIDAIKAATGDGFIGYVWGNVLKYLWRWPKKGGADDLKKARWYLDRLIKEVGE